MAETKTDKGPQRRNMAAGNPNPGTSKANRVWHGLPARPATARRFAETSENTAKPVPSKVEGMAVPPTGEPKSGYWWGTGRRKSAVARVRIKPGNGKLLINKRQLNDYFKREQDQQAVTAPLEAIKGEKSFDVFVNVQGGGITGQSGATRLGVARALKNYDENFTQPLRDGGHLTRDPRMVERKKPGQRGARRRFQFSKR